MKNFNNYVYARERTIYVQVIPLHLDESLNITLLPILGKITSGSINIDGTSSIRRTCNLTIAVDESEMEQDLTGYNWTLSTKFKLQIAIGQPSTQNDYIDMGIYGITSFSKSRSVNNLTITLNGKDKMCYLNGELGGTFTEQTDISSYDQLDDNGDVLEKKQLTIAQMIYSLLNRGGVPKNRVNIDIPAEGKNWIEYRGDENLYIITSPNESGHQVVALTVQGKQKLNDGSCLQDLGPGFYSDKTLNGCNIFVSEYGKTVGYETTDLYYPGDLVANTGETITSMLDKIVAIFPTHEYFFDVNGDFYFQQKVAHYGASYADSGDARNNSEHFSLTYPSLDNAWNFTDNVLFTQIGETPVITDIKNDYSVWGVKKGVSGDIPIHRRLVIVSGDNWPQDVNGLEALYNEAKSYYENDCVGGDPMREPYYLDMYSCWRSVYNPNPKVEYRPTTAKDTKHTLYDTKIINGSGSPVGQYPIENILVDGNYVVDSFNLKNYASGVKDYYIKQGNSIINLLDKTDADKRAIYFEKNSSYQRLCYEALAKTSGSIAENMVFFKIQNGLIASAPIDAIQYYNIAETAPKSIPGCQTSGVDCYLFTDTFYYRGTTSGFGDLNACNITSLSLSMDLSKVSVNDLKTIKVSVDGDDMGDLTNNMVYYKMVPWFDDDYVPFIRGTNEEGDIIYTPLIRYEWNDKPAAANCRFRKKTGENTYEYPYIFDTITFEKIKVCDQDGNIYFDDYISSLSSGYTVTTWEPALSGDSSSTASVATRNKFDWKGELKGQYQDPIGKVYKHSEYYLDGDLKGFRIGQETLAQRTFWIEFLKADDKILSNYGIEKIGRKPIGVNDEAVRALGKDINEQVLVNFGKTTNGDLTTIPLPYQGYFVVSSQGKSAADALDELLYKHAAAPETIQLTSLPIYEIQPNELAIFSEQCAVQGTYLINKLSYNLGYQGTMSMSLTKLPVDPGQVDGVV